MEWVSGGTKRQCNRALALPRRLVECLLYSAAVYMEILYGAVVFFFRTPPMQNSACARVSFVTACCSPSPGRRRHATLPSTAIDRHSLEIYTAVLLLLLAGFTARPPVIGSTRCILIFQVSIFQV
jgi:hypothetical protein